METIHGLCKLLFPGYHSYFREDFLKLFAVNKDEIKSTHPELGHTLTGCSHRCSVRPLYTDANDLYWDICRKLKVME